MKRILNIILFFLFAIPVKLSAQSDQVSTAHYREDYEYFWKSINEEYCYFNKKQTDWQKVKEIYEPRIEKITTRDQFVSILEKSLNEIYDHHAVLNTNTDSSNRLVPSGTDTWAEFVKGKPTIIELRKSFGTEACGVLPGMEIVSVNDVPVEEAIKPLLPKSLKSIDTESKNFALRLLLAGDHITKRKFTLRYKGVQKDFYPDQNGMQLENIHHSSLVDSRLIGTTGYIIINDCLYNDDLIAAFDSVMQTMKNTSALILDFRNTPSGGNTSVAKAIIGWFITKDHFYQKHEYYADEKNTGIKRSWEEIVSPRNGKYYEKALVILCNHWTGSVGEGIIIGFDALSRPFTKIIGTQMAQLNGAVYSYELPNTKIHFGFPAERLYHINGLPREQFKPGISIDPKWNTQQHDECISMAIAWLKGPK